METVAAQNAQQRHNNSATLQMHQLHGAMVSSTALFLRLFTDLVPNTLPLVADIVNNHSGCFFSVVKSKSIFFIG